MQRPRERRDNPIVFFDVSIGEKTAGRLLIEVDRQPVRCSATYLASIASTPPYTSFS
jgi:hypothetical protein